MLDGAPILGVSSFHALDDVGPASLNGLLTGPAFDLPGGALVEFAEPPQQCVYPKARRGFTAGHDPADADDLAIRCPRTVPDHHLGHTANLASDTAPDTNERLEVMQNQDLARSVRPPPTPKSDTATSPIPMPESVLPG